MHKQKVTIYTKLGLRKSVFPKMTKMGSIFGHKIDYYGVGVLRGQRHIPVPSNFNPSKGWLSVFRQSTCDVAADTACDTTPTYENITPPARETSQVFTAGMPVKSNSCQLRRHAGGEDLRWPQLPATCVLISERYCRQHRQTCWGHFAGSSAAYENQA